MCIDEYLYMKYTQYRKLKEMTRHRLLRNDDWGLGEGDMKRGIKRLKNKRLFSLWVSLVFSKIYWLCPVQPPICRVN